MTVYVVRERSTIYGVTGSPEAARALAERSVIDYFGAPIIWSGDVGRYNDGAHDYNLVYIEAYPLEAS